MLCVCREREREITNVYCEVGGARQLKTIHPVHCPPKVDPKRGFRKKGPSQVT